MLITGECGYVFCIVVINVILIRTQFQRVVVLVCNRTVRFKHSSMLETIKSLRVNAPVVLRRW